MKEKRSFGKKLSEEENSQIYKNGKIIYIHLREKYPSETDEDLDIVLNSLCAGLVFLIRDSVSPDNYRYVLQLVYKMLSENLCELDFPKTESKNDKSFK